MIWDVKAIRPLSRAAVYVALLWILVVTEPVSSSAKKKTPIRRPGWHPMWNRLRQRRRNSNRPTRLDHNSLIQTEQWFYRKHEKVSVILASLG
jgi:hypothetical protein